MISPTPGARTSIAATVRFVVVEAHVEGLDVLGVVHHDDGATDEGLGQVALVFGLQINPPAYVEFELLAFVCSAFEASDRFSVLHAFEVRRDDLREPCDALRVDVLSKEIHFLRALVEHAFEYGLEEGFGEIGIVGQRSKRHFWLDHPKLGEVTRGVRIFCSKGRTEGVHATHRATVRFEFQLTGYG